MSFDTLSLVFKEGKYYMVSNTTGKWMSITTFDINTLRAVAEVTTSVHLFPIYPWHVMYRPVTGN